MASGSCVEGLADESTLAPPIFNRQGIEKVHVPVDILNGYTFPIAEFARAKTDQEGRLMPQIIAHRGFKTRFPENSLLAFREAVRAGATALEIDVHLTKDDVIVLRHDGNLKKFGHQ